MLMDCMYLHTYARTYVCIQWDMLHGVLVHVSSILHTSHVSPEKSYERDLTANGLAHILGEPMKGDG